MNVFDRYPSGGRQLLGRPRSGDGTCRSGYGLALKQLTGETCCAYCGINLVDDYHKWLLLSRDHVVPTGEARRLGISPTFFEDAINLVISCAGCNGFDNRYSLTDDPQETWTLEEFLILRNATFADRFQRIAARRELEMTKFELNPWPKESVR